MSNNCNNCKNCYYCLSNEQLIERWNKTIQKPLFSRLLSCNCFMCNDKESASCIEVAYYMKYMNDSRDIQYILNMIDNDRKKLKKDSS